MLGKRGHDLGPDVASQRVLAKRRVSITQPVVRIRNAVVRRIVDQELFKHLCGRLQYATFKQTEGRAVGC